MVKRVTSEGIKLLQVAAERLCVEANALASSCAGEPETGMPAARYILATTTRLNREATKLEVLALRCLRKSGEVKKLLLARKQGLELEMAELTRRLDAMAERKSEPVPSASGPRITA